MANSNVKDLSQTITAKTSSRNGENIATNTKEMSYSNTDKEKGETSQEDKKVVVNRQGKILPLCLACHIPYGKSGKCPKCRNVASLADYGFTLRLRNGENMLEKLDTREKILTFGFVPTKHGKMAVDTYIEKFIDVPRSVIRNAIHAYECTDEKYWDTLDELEEEEKLAAQQTASENSLHKKESAAS